MHKTILITGSTDGIGLLTAKKLSMQGHQVLLHGRSKTKLSLAVAEIGQVASFCADLSHMKEVKKLANDVRAHCKHLDVLINNAGVLKSAETRTRAGRDIRFDVNSIAPYILTQNLLPIMPADGRVINLSSAAQAPVNIDSLVAHRPMSDMDAYAQSKLAITIWSQEMAKAMPDGPIFVAINPGSKLATKMVKEGFGVDGRDLNIGANIIFRAAVSKDFEASSGKYFDNDRGDFVLPHQASRDQSQVKGVMHALSEISHSTF